jgi:hypothetical protein
MSWVGVGVEDVVITKGLSAAPVYQIMLTVAECSKTTLASLVLYPHLTSTLGNMQNSISFLNNDIEHV